MVRLIVGLGNPGQEYAGTRHNVGFEVIDELSNRHDIPVRKRDFRAVIGEGFISGHKVILARPMTYMNLSGEAVGAIARMFKIEPADIWVILDDVALPLGRIRLRLKGSPGGHNGLKSIQAHLHTNEYPRIRIGVGGPTSTDLVDHVLSRFYPEEREVISDSIDRAADAVEQALEVGFERAMNQFNN